jgi:hypothetical protein
MELAKFLKKRERPSGPAPDKWLSAVKLKVQNGSLFVGDPHLDPADAYVARVPAGKYILEAKLRDFDNEWYVSRIRARLDGYDDPLLGKQIGETCTDLATIAFYDLVAAEDAIAGDSDRYLELLFKKDFETCGIVQVRMKKTLTIAYVNTGFDCGALVYELRSGRRRIGVEVEIEFEELEASLEEEPTDSSQLVDAPSEPAGFRDGVCIHCHGSGDCYCIRKGAKTAERCPRCSGSGKCNVCQGRGRVSPV